MKHAVAVFLLCVIAGAGSGCGEPPPIMVVLKGETPIFGLKEYRSQEGFILDERRVEYFCPNCRHPDISFKRKTCKWCEGEIAWPKSIWCKFCNGSGKCPACMIARKTAGKCFSCDGLGYNKFGGDCPNCKSVGKCPICAGSTKCDFCGGEGRVDLQMLESQRERLSQPAPVIGAPEAGKEEEQPPAEESGEEKPKEGEPEKKEGEEKKEEGKGNE